MNGIILCSGGLDSVAVAHFVKSKLDNIKILFIDYGQRSLEQEEKHARICAKNLNAEFLKVKLPWLKEICTSKLTTQQNLPTPDISNTKTSRADITNYWVPARNSIFVNIALAFAESLDLQGKGIYDIYLGIKNEGNVPMKDTTPEFLKTMNQVAKQATLHGRYEVIAPFIQHDKVELIKKCNKILNWTETYSCYKGHQYTAVSVKTVY